MRKRSSFRQERAQSQLTHTQTGPAHSHTNRAEVHLSTLPLVRASPPPCLVPFLHTHIPSAPVFDGVTTRSSLKMIGISDSWRMLNHPNDDLNASTRRETTPKLRSGGHHTNTKTHSTTPIMISTQAPGERQHQNHLQGPPHQHQDPLNHPHHDLDGVARRLKGSRSC